MCRMLAYLGNPIFIENVLIKTQHSLLAQSMSARETKFHVNGDGCGLGWYPHYDELNKPVLFKSIRPAWNDPNLKHLSSATKSSCFIAHIRAATEGNISYDNCHPFLHKDRLLVHNGAIDDFNKIKRAVISQLPDEIYNWTQGQTDSEHFYALVLKYLLPHGNNPTTTQIIESMEKALTFIQNCYDDLQLDDALMHINTFLTRGNCLIAMRYTSRADKPASTMYYAQGYIKAKGEHFYMSDEGEGEKSVLLVSEKLDDFSNWVEVPENHFLVVHRDRSVEHFPINAPFFQ